MSSLLYYSIARNLSPQEKAEIDRSVYHNQKYIINLLTKVSFKKTIVGISILKLICFNDISPVNAISLPNPVMMKIEPKKYEHIPEIQQPVVLNRRLYIQFSSKVPCEILYMTYWSKSTSNVKCTQESLKLVTQIRGGSLLSFLAIYAALVILAGLISNAPIHGFIPLNRPPMPMPNNNFWPNEYKPEICRRAAAFKPKFSFRPKTFSPFQSSPPQKPGFMTLQIEKPAAMPHQEYVPLTRGEKRALRHELDMHIVVENKPELLVGYNQAQFKVKDHGAVHGLPFRVRDNNSTATDATRENTLQFMDSIVNMPNREDVMWITEGRYQGNTDRGFNAIHLYDKNTKTIAVFEKTNNAGIFVTSCQLTGPEEKELFKTNNFGGGEGWFTGRVRNVAPDQTYINTFESDITETSPIDSIEGNNNNNESSNFGFTPINSFESDVMNISPTDSSSLE